MWKRMITVAKEHSHYLDAAVKAAAAAAGYDTYQAVKHYLNQKGVPHHDTNMKPDDVPSNMAYWHN